MKNTQSAPSTGIHMNETQNLCAFCYFDMFPIVKHGMCLGGGGSHKMYVLVLWVLGTLITRSIDLWS